ncbi:MAG: NADH-quinone oxidoreductase subunit NuoK [Candidatus Micrarchaeia archaeon]
MSIMIVAILSFFMLSFGIAGVVSSKNMIMIIISAELILVAASLAVVSFAFESLFLSVMEFLLTIWSVMAMEIIALVAAYRYMHREEISFDIDKLSSLKG